VERTSNVQAHERQRIRLIYEKGEAIKFISHQDEFRMWERILRRADLPLLYKQGFNPQPHIQFASPLGVGFTGVREPLDIILSPPLPLGELRQRIEARLPPGVTLHGLEEAPLKTESPQSLLIGADYTILVYAEPGEIPEERLQGRIQEFLAQTEIWRERERKGTPYIYNLRPLVYELRYVDYNPEGEAHCIFLRVQQREGATGRPDEVAAALGFAGFARTLRRERLYFADQAEDVAIFSTYPVVTQREIARSVEKGRLTEDETGDKTEKRKSRAGRSISERAGDEFL
jgi:radical SAM-linked protein